MQWIDGIMFETIHHTSLSLLSRLLGILIIWETMIWIKVYPQILAPDGWYSKKYFLDDKENTRFSLLRYFPNVRYLEKILLFMMLTSGAFMAYGIMSSLIYLLCFVAMISIQSRNIFAVNGGDQVRRMLCLLLIFAPIGEGPAWPLIIIQLFVANIYFKAVYNKLRGEKWRNGTATHGILNVRIMTRFAIPAIIDRKGFHAMITYSTLLIETALFTFIWIDELRPYVIIAGILMHVMMGIFLRLSLFQASMIVALLVFW